MLLKLLQGIGARVTIVDIDHRRLAYLSEIYAV